MKKNSAVLLVILFIILIVGGRYVFSRNDSYKLESSSSPSSVQVSPASQNKDSSPSDTPEVVAEKKDTSVSGCVADEKKKAEDAHTEYEKGTLLVGFTSNVSFDDALKTLGTYGATVKNTPSAKESYPDRRLISASVEAGSEFNKLCIIKRDASVRYVGLNVLFSLHQ